MTAGSLCWYTHMQISAHTSHTHNTLRKPTMHQSVADASNWPKSLCSFCSSSQRRFCNNQTGCCWLGSMALRKPLAGETRPSNVDQRVFTCGMHVSSSSATSAAQNPAQQCRPNHSFAKHKNVGCSIAAGYPRTSHCIPTMHATSRNIPLSYKEHNDEGST
jgi:hypothetical protein